MDLPNLLATQLESYEEFLQKDIDPLKRKVQMPNLMCRVLNNW